MSDSSISGPNSGPIIETHEASGIVCLCLNQPDRHNALSPEMIAALHAAFIRLGDDPDCRLVCLKATPADKQEAGNQTAVGSFCAGGDLLWMRQQIDAPRARRMAEAATLANLLRVMNRFPKPLLGAVDGNAFGGGIGVMAVCDEVLATDNLIFGLTETRLGLIPATISPYVVARIGAAAARALFMSARRFDSQTAYRIGLVTSLVPASDFASATKAMIAPYLATSPSAMQAAKGLIGRLTPAIDDAVIDMTIAALADCWEHPDAGEGVDAFFAKRPPSWAKPAADQ
jgi:methylglutaconyl-CoA hydratase